MQYLVISQRDARNFTDEDFGAVIPAETEIVRKLYGNGIIRQIWLRGDVRGACFLLEAESFEEAEATVNGLPISQRGMSEFQIIPLRPYGGFTS
ncbi:hypothetical protein F8M49_23490 [Rhodococcus zopfii]|uniref:Muconolactone isomerase domain-containing protein n=1 Tax=Rhodococcus zopfii TaxID=43772 RepID=A0ABU3WW33_9NOCA|nr:hypothetical protein [Rhodococcus zopfii]